MGDADIHGVYLGDIFAVDAIVERVGFEPAAVTLGTEQIGAVARQQDAHMHAVAAPFEAAKPAADAFVFAVAVDDQLALLVAQFAPRRFHRDFLALTKVEQPFGSALAVDPGFDGAVARDFPGLGITRSISISMTRPKPLQVSQAPSGLLNEKIFGTGSR